jgi:hypothetical protein
MNNDLITFLQAWTGGADVSDAERQRLLRRLQTDADFRAECAEEIRLLGMIKAVQTPPPRWLGIADALGLNAETMTAPGTSDFANEVMDRVRQREPKLQSSRSRWLSWRPLAAAAAGLMFGMFCTSLVMAYMAPPTGKSLTLLSDGFEDGARKWTRGFPDQAGVWGGDAGEMVSGSGEVQPLDGLRMARLDPSPTATLSYLDRIVDVQSLPVPQGNEVRQVTVTASFHAAERGLRDRYTLRVAAFAEAPETVRGQWVGREWKEMDGALAASKRGLSTTPDAEGWQTLTAIVEVPREARSLVISLASGLSENPDRKTAHYIDGVQATLSIGSQPVKTKTRRLNLTAK